MPAEEQRLNQTVLLYRRSGDWGLTSWLRGKLQRGELENNPGDDDFSAVGVEDMLGFASLNWNVTELVDSKYEVKIQSQCVIATDELLPTIPNELEYYNTETIEVIIDRTPPAIYGTPAVELHGPVNFVKHFEYTISFTEPLYCEMPFVFNLELTFDGQTSFTHGDGIHVMCTGNTIKYRFDMNRLERFETDNPTTGTGVRVVLLLAGVEDVARNQMVQTDPNESIISDSTWDRSTSALDNGSLNWQSLPPGMHMQMQMWQMAAAAGGLGDDQASCHVCDSRTIALALTLDHHFCRVRKEFVVFCIALVHNSLKSTVLAAMDRTIIVTDELMNVWKGQQEDSRASECGCENFILFRTKLNKCETHSCRR